MVSNSRRIALCFPTEPRHIAAIQAAAPDDEVVDAGQDRIADEILKAYIFCGHAKVPVPWEKVVAEGRLQWIQSSAAGMDHCLVPEVIDSPIVVSSASGLFANQVAEQTMALLLGLIRSMPTFYRAQQEKSFERRPTDDLHGKTVGIVGFGGNGRRIAEVLAPWCTKLLATDCFPVEKPKHVENLWPVEKTEQLLADSDIVILCVPLNAQTHGWFNANLLARMKSGSYLVNVARGSVVVESDLVAAIESGHLRGVGLDVTEMEPLAPSSPLWQMPQVVITPHVGAQSAVRVDTSTRLFCENIAYFDNGKRLLNQVDKSLGFPRPEDHQGLREHRDDRFA